MEEDFHSETMRKAYTPQMRRKSCVPALSQSYQEPKLLTDSVFQSHEYSSAFVPVNKSRLVQRRMSVQPISSSSQHVKQEAKRSFSASGQSVHFAEPEMFSDYITYERRSQLHDITQSHVRENPVIYHEETTQHSYDSIQSGERTRQRRFSEGATPSQVVEKGAAKHVASSAASSESFNDRELCEQP